jgi:hypothetical protein
MFVSWIHLSKLSKVIHNRNHSLGFLHFVGI